MKIALAEALLRRKELALKVSQLQGIQRADLFEVKVKRTKVSDQIDDIVAEVPKLTASQVTAEFDFYARALRKVDAVIQQANWSTQVLVDDVSMEDYKAPQESLPAPRRRKVSAQ